jgi:glycine betaine/proline transport system substrate-binding protein
MSQPLVLGQIGLSFHIAAAGVLRTLLAQDGIEVVIKEAPHEQLYEMLGRGEVDLLCSAWLPGSHGVYIDPIADHIEKLSVIYTPYTIWGVPDYVPASAVAHVADLGNPAVAAQMTKLIQGIGPGAGISRFSREIVAAYGLDSLGYHFENGTQADCFGAFEAAVREQRWCIVPLWHPQYLHHTHRIRALEEPKGLLRGKDDATLVMRKQVADRMPANTLRWLRKIQLGNETVTALDHMLCVEKMDPVAAAQRWMKDNASRVNDWRA